MTPDSPPFARILVIDDEPQIRRFLRISLSSQGYEVLEADHARQGLELAATQAPDLVVLDLGLPDMDGKQALAELRSWTAVPVIILSVRAGEAEKVTALDSGANDYVTKPFGIQEFLARVRNLLRRSPAEATDEKGGYDDGHLVIDPVRRRVSLAGVPVRLTRKEYAALRLLVMHADRVVTQSQLLNEIWGPSHREDTHYLRIIVGRLRQKLGDNPNEPRYLHTEPGVGYRFIASHKDDGS